MKYIKPQITSKKIKLNMFLSDRSRDSFAFPLIGPVFAQSVGGGGGGVTGGGGGGSACGSTCNGCNCQCAPGGANSANGTNSAQACGPNSCQGGGGSCGGCGGAGQS